VISKTLESHPSWLMYKGMLLGLIRYHIIAGLILITTTADRRKPGWVAPIPVMACTHCQQSMSCAVQVHICAFEQGTKVRLESAGVEATGNIDYAIRCDYTGSIETLINSLLDTICCDEVRSNCFRPRGSRGTCCQVTRPNVAAKPNLMEPTM